jgi:phosphoglycerate dehydrogenase-like enzyme
LGDRAVEAAFRLRLSGFRAVIHPLPPASEDELVRRLADCDYALPFFGGVRLGASVLGRLPRLKGISVAGPGARCVDRQAAERLGIRVADTPGAAVDAVAEMTMALMLSWARGLPGLFAGQAGGSWESAYGTGLQGRILGVVGLGAIGARIAELGRAFGMRVCASRAARPEQDSPAGGDGRIERLALEDLAAAADFLTLHAREPEPPRVLIDRRILSLLKPTACLVNTARASLVDQDALYEALASGRLAGAALDVFDEEPQPAGSRWRELPNVIATPHCAWKTLPVLDRFLDRALDNLIALATLEET